MVQTQMCLLLSPAVEGGLTDSELPTEIADWVLSALRMAQTESRPLNCFIRVVRAAEAAIAN